MNFACPQVARVSFYEKIGMSLNFMIVIYHSKHGNSDIYKNQNE